MPLDYGGLYPRAGSVALLCEGDIAGYEAAALRSWADLRLGTSPLVDIWTCGTATAIIGVSDAIGRARPIVAIEDRDYRSSAFAAETCQDHKKDRLRRGVRLFEWRCWQRHEIENYLLEPLVIEPVMADAFACNEEEIRSSLCEIIPALASHESYHHAFTKVFWRWPTSGRTRDLHGVNHSPQWKEGSLRPPVFGEVKEAVSRALEGHHRDLEKQGGTLYLCGLSDFVALFDSKFEEWREVTYESPIWITDWAGKETLQYLRMVLAARRGWWDRTARQLTPVKWDEMNAERRRGLDREIEAELRPRLVRRFIDYLQGEAGPDLRDEWESLAQSLRSAPAAQ